MESSISPNDARRVLARFAVTGPSRIEPLGSGLINDTFAVTDGSRELVLQRVHPVFAPEIHHNIAAVTGHLHARGISTPQLVRTVDEQFWTEDGGRVWRLMTRLPGVTFDAVASVEQARAAAGALGAFHRALTDLDHAFVGLRVGVHDTARHLTALQEAVAEHPSHRLASAVAPLAERILTAAEDLPPLDGLPVRVVHGDPKLNNVVFEGASPPANLRAVGMIDLDTVAPMALHLELGDAWRSWCNPKGEDETTARFDLDVFEASLQGYAAAGPRVSAEERDALGHAVELISLELSARFLADALHERYFGWNPQLHPSRGEHNLVRAQGQWSLHRAVQASRSDRERLLGRLLG